MDVETAAGVAEIGAFTTTEPWTPSDAFDVAQLVRARVLSTGETAALFHEVELSNEAALAVFGGAGAGTYPLANLVDPTDMTSPLAARLVEADDHSPEVVATEQDGTVVVFGISGASLTTTATGLTGTVVAADRDATGIYAWIATAAGVSRARPGTPWTIDRGPFAPTYGVLAGAVTSDGTLWVVESEPAGAGAAFVSLQTLAPTATDFAALERAAPTSYTGQISAAVLLLGGDGVHALVSATADAGGTATTLTPRLRTADSTWSDAPALPGLVQYAFIGTTLAAIVNDVQAKSTSLVADVTMPATAQVIPVWPVLSEGVAIDTGGRAHPLVTNGTVAYALTPAP